MSATKPGLWLPHQAGVDPSDAWFWEGLISLVPMWENHAELTDFVNRTYRRTDITNRGGDPTAKVGRVGPYIEWDGIGDWVQWHPSDSPFSGLTAMSWVIVFRRNTDGSQVSVIRKDGTMNIQFPASAFLSWTVWPGGTLDGGNSVGNYGLGEWNVAVGSWDDSKSEINMWLQGLEDVQRYAESIALAVGSNGALGNNASNAYRWAATENDTELMDADLALFAAWDRALSKAEALKLLMDPFRFIRPALWPMYPALASGEETVNLFVRHSRRRAAA